MKRKSLVLIVLLALLILSIILFGSSKRSYHIDETNKTLRCTSKIIQINGENVTEQQFFDEKNISIGTCYLYQIPRGTPSCGRDTCSSERLLKLADSLSKCAGHSFPKYYCNNK